MLKLHLYIAWKARNREVVHFQFTVWMWQNDVVLQVWLGRQGYIGRCLASYWCSRWPRGVRSILLWWRLTHTHIIQRVHQFDCTSVLDVLNWCNVHELKSGFMNWILKSFSIPNVWQIVLCNTVKVLAFLNRNQVFWSHLLQRWLSTWDALSFF